MARSESSGKPGTVQLRERVPSSTLRAPAVEAKAPPSIVTRPGRGERPLVVYEHLRELIVLGRLTPGSPLIETELADRLGVSRTPIRGALQRLYQEGLITEATGPRAFKYLVAPLTRDDAESLFHIMAELEGLAAHDAASLPAVERAELVRALTAINAELRTLAHTAAPHSDQFFELDRSFHRSITTAGSKPRLLALHASIEPNVERYWRVYAAVREDAVGKSAGEHDAIVRALAQGDPDGAQYAIRKNWRKSADRLTPTIDRMGERGSWR